MTVKVSKVEILLAYLVFFLVILNQNFWYRRLFTFLKLFWNIFQKTKIEWVSLIWTFYEIFPKVFNLKNNSSLSYLELQWSDTSPPTPTCRDTGPCRASKQTKKLIPPPILEILPSFFFQVIRAAIQNSYQSVIFIFTARSKKRPRFFCQFLKIWITDPQRTDPEYLMIQRTRDTSTQSKPCIAK